MTQDLSKCPENNTMPDPSKCLENNTMPDPSKCKEKESMPAFFTYIVKCSDGTFYTGYTNDLSKRIKTHNSGKGAKYTKHRLPVELVYYESFETKEEAMSREWHIKRLSRAEKEKLIIQNK